MTFSELREKVRCIIEGYFANATVVYSEAQNLVKPNDPFIRLRISRLRRGLFSINEVFEGGLQRLVESQAAVTIELFTHGKKEYADNGLIFRNNTAVNDLSDLVNYLQSRFVDDINDVVFISDGEVIDQTAPLDGDFEYRALVDMTVKFWQVLKGYADVSGNGGEETASGGRAANLANMDVFDIDFNKIEIEQEEE